MPPRKKPDEPTGQINLVTVPPSTGPMVGRIKQAVEEWRRQAYPGVTNTTRILLNHWFHKDHILKDGTRFQYHAAQREAMETLVYLYEVADMRRLKTLLEAYGSGPLENLLQYDQFARYCIKMATGSGKTKVMAMAVAWQYFNAKVEGRDDYASTFLILAPNVIVFERLSTDFANGAAFRSDPLIPRELAIYWDMAFYMRGDPERASSEGALYLTNIQQFHRPDANDADTVPDAIAAVMGPKPPATLTEIPDFEERLVARGGPLMVLNDEAHHTHDEKLKWNEVIRRLNDDGGGVAAQLDFTATPRHTKGSLFAWTVYDYPLKQAIMDGIVKRPVKGMAKGIKEQKSDIARVKYKAYLTAGVERWREYREQLAPLGQKPLLFFMLNDTKEADDVAEYLRSAYPSQFGGGEKLLVIHTDNTGEVSKKDLDLARKAAREVDNASSPVNAIVSVLMLREGWDVKNVTVVVGLRPYSSKAKILPEQTIGRGLRLMFRGLGSDYKERVDIIGNDAFIEFVEQLEKDEGMVLESFDVGKDKLTITVVEPDLAKSDKDIAIPVLSPILARKKTLADEIAELELPVLDPPMSPKPNALEAEAFQYQGFDLLTLEKLVDRKYRIPEPQTAEEVISYYAGRIAQDLKMPSHFAVLAPRVREFLKDRAFGGTVDLDTPDMIRAISQNAVQYIVLHTFAGLLKPLIVEELTPTLLGEARRLSQTPPFPFSRATFSASKTVYNLVAPDNPFEEAFARFLQKAEDVERFAKLSAPFGFAVHYTDTNGNLRLYEPDFVAVTADGTHHLLETKGREDVDVARKDHSARIWCDNASRLTDTQWRFLKIPQSEFSALRPDDFADLRTLQYAGA
jgi:type III restriction enzyme